MYKRQVSRYLAANVTPRFEAPPLDDFSFARGDDDPAMFPSPPEGYYARLRSRVQELLRPASAALPPAAPAPPPSAMALPPAASAPPPPVAVEDAAAPLLQRVAVPAGDWRIVGAQVQDVDDSTVRGVITDSRNACNMEVTTTPGVVVMK